jgi:ribonuclease HII
MILGIDEAGRGPCLGPLVIAGVAIDKSNLNLLNKLGVKDSKQLNKKQRVILEKKIYQLADKVELIIIRANEIDKLREKFSLNIIELLNFAKIINAIQPECVYLDLPDVGKRFIPVLKSKLFSSNIEIIAEHKADLRYPIVSAASIIAKCVRDKKIRDLEKQLGLEIGSGYPTDPKTINFIAKYYHDNGNLPLFVRRSWATTKTILKQITQKKLVDFI